ncbi:type II secretion system protein [Roseateles sp. BYS78W]|uniref:Type II secretion system protein n=1 Tax=Pelomonas candidula TaxID=3299025 RepID=A0ABW7HFT0_9BURK
MRPPQRPGRGFTVIELIVVLAVIGLLLSIVAPRYARHVDRSRETVLRQNLAAVRDAIDKFYADRGRYPADLDELARERYLREVPMDPITDRRDSWLVQAPRAPQQGGVFEVHSGAGGQASDGTPYASW